MGGSKISATNDETTAVKAAASLRIKVNADWPKSKTDAAAMLEKRKSKVH